MSARKDEAAPSDLATELVLATDGRLYVNSEDVDPRKLRKRELFEGRAVRWSAPTTAPMLLGALVAGKRVALGSDGRVYVEIHGRRTPSGKQNRRIFRGYALTPEEQTIAATEAHRLAFNITIAVQQVLKERRKSGKQRNARRRAPAAKAA